MAKKPVTKLTAKHHIGYGAGDAGGVLMLMVISYLERFSRNILGIDPLIYAGILVVWNVWDAINDPLVGTFMDFAFMKAKNKANKFRPWILRSIPILAIGMGSLMTLPTLFDGLMCIVVRRSDVHRRSVRFQDRLRAGLHHYEHRHGLPAGRHGYQRC